MTPSVDVTASMNSHHRTVQWPTFDHLAFGVHRWRDGYPQFVSELGGDWGFGAVAGDFAPCQLVFGDGMRIEFLAPADDPGGEGDGRDGDRGFLRRFLARRGPGVHHLTFKVPDLDDALRALRRYGFETIGQSREHAVWMETFVHPRASGIGTLVQIVRADDETLSAREASAERPADFPEPGGRRAEPSILGLTVDDLDRAHDLLGRALLGDVLEDGDGWFFVTWGRGRSIIVRRREATPVAEALWAAAPPEGVAFILCGRGDLTASEVYAARTDLRRLPDSAAAGVPLWLLGS